MSTKATTTARQLQQALLCLLEHVPGRAAGAAEPISDHVALLPPEEQVLVERAVERRRQEFSTGRQLARRLMGSLGLEAGPIPRGPRREPCWPDGVQGSITHADELAAVVVAPASGSGAFGIDLERWDRVGDELHRKLFTEPELAFLAGGGEELPGLLFSAKEAGYKATYPLAGKFISFHDAETVLDPASGSFRFRYLGDHEPSRVMESGRGYYAICERYVLSLFIIP